MNHLDRIYMSFILDENMGGPFSQLELDFLRLNSIEILVVNECPQFLLPNLTPPPPPR